MNENTTLDITHIAQHVYTVSQLNSEVRTVLMTNFPFIWVEGEISNLACPSSGHVYFSLKDQNAQLRCAMFRTQHRRLPFQLENGAHIIAAGNVSLYEGRGEYQLIVEQIELAGDGKLRMAFEALKNKLATEGLFELAHKKSIPRLPKHIGVITSPTGAAIHDILTVLKRRCPSIPVMIYPTAVQGANAATQITQAIHLANEHQLCDVLIVARGGGSLEDLWPFNEEIVARAIFASEIPIISGVGHEVDFTIADFVADQRAPTPSAAAELVSPNSEEMKQALQGFALQMVRFIKSHLRHENLLLNQLEKRLKHPGQRLREQAQNIDHLEQYLYASILRYLAYKNNKIQTLNLKLDHYNPLATIKHWQLQCTTINNRLRTMAAFELRQVQQKLANLGQRLNSVSPLNVIERGYAIVSDADNKIIRTINNLKTGAQINARLSNGIIKGVITEIKEIKKE